MITRDIFLHAHMILANDLDYREDRDDPRLPTVVREGMSIAPVTMKESKRSSGTIQEKERHECTSPPTKTTGPRRSIKTRRALSHESGLQA